MRSVKVLAAQTDRSLTSTLTELVRRGLAASESGERSSRVQLPLVKTAGQASAEELSPERIAQVLLAVDVDQLAR